MAGKRKPAHRKKVERKQVTLRLVQEEFDRFHEVAEEMDMPVSMWIRMVCRRASGLPTP